MFIDIEQLVSEVSAKEQRANGQSQGKFFATSLDQFDSGTSKSGVME